MKKAMHLTPQQIVAELDEYIIGQKAAKRSVAIALRNRWRRMNADPEIREEIVPNNILMIGPTGVGKTELARTLAEFLFNDAQAMIRIDMSEYMEKFSISRLIGAPPGYVGYEEGGQLSERVRRQPYSIILLDEIEKAHPDVFNMLLQVLDDGFLTDSVGRKVDFKNTVIIMTSNIGTRKLKDFGNGVGFDTNYMKYSENKNIQDILKKSLSKKFSPEFLNRIDEIVVFNQLSVDNIEKIAKIEITKFVERLKEIDYLIKIDSKAIKFIAKKGYDKEYGARPIKRAIQKHLEDVIAKEIVQNNFKKGDKINITVIKDQLEIKKI